MVIRLAKQDDVRLLQDLTDKIFIDNPKYDIDLKMDWAQSDIGKNYFRKVIRNPNSICLIAEKNDMAIGFITAASKDFDYRLSKYIEIEIMGVLPNHCFKGVGSKLIRKCLKMAKEKNFQRVYVNSYIDNVKAINFYETNGFKKIDISLEKDI